MFCVYGVLNGIFHSSAPPASSTPTMFCCDCVTTCRTPFSSTIIGEAYPGPSPFQLHRNSPDPASKAVSAPPSLPPTCAISSPRSTTGDIAVPNNGEVSANCLENSLRQRSSPVAPSKQERMPPIPSVYTRPPEKTGVDFGPSPCFTAAGFIL